ncbi:uncharacterized protein LOC106672703 isoform X2 [Cimex lectularius]|uniref:malate dehydrogenase n=1 Tax=Cimex lectularius TaxID=79782 RepID=A0A8I6TH99_CIMLE|nr:uncharacterized protein LOC106672703 isoform X2 [Cimex lectularius]
MGKAQCCVNRKKLTILGLNSLFAKLSSFLLKQSPHINRLALYDEDDVGFPCDISNINTQCKIRAYIGQDQLQCAVKNSDVVLIGDQEDITSLVPHHKRNLHKESSKLHEYACAIAENAPQAVVLVAISPVNCLLPLVSEYLINLGVYDCNKVLGVTAVDNVRANKLAANFLNMDPRKVILPVIGGSSPDTRVPVFSQARPTLNLTKKNWLSMTWDIKNSETLIHRTRGQAESVNKAYATVRFVHSVLAGLRGEPNIAEILLAKTILVPETSYFALPVILGPQGIKYRFNLPVLTQSETLLVEHAAKCINRDVENGLKYLDTKYFPDDTICDAKSLVGTLIKKLCSNGNNEDVSKKPEYLLMTNKQTVDLNPEFKPSETPVAMPFVENENCAICNKGCTPLILPVPPSTPRKVHLSSPSTIKEVQKASTPFAPIVGKEKDKNFNTFDSIVNCVDTESKKSDNLSSNLPSLKNSNNNESVANSIIEERIKAKAKTLRDEKEREEIRKHSKNSLILSKKKDDIKGESCEKKGEDIKLRAEIEILCQQNRNNICKECKTMQKNDTAKSEFNGDNWPENYGEKKEFFDLKEFKKRPVPNWKDKFQFTEHKTECSVEKKNLLELIFSMRLQPPKKPKLYQTKMEPTSYILSKKKNLLNFGRKEKPVISSNQVNYFSKLYDFFCSIGNAKPEKKFNLIKDNVEMNCKEIEETSDVDKDKKCIKQEKKKSLHCVQTNPSLLGLLTSIKASQKEFAKRKELTEKNAGVDHLKLCKQIDDFAKTKMDKLSKVYTPKYPHLLHGSYPESSLSKLTLFKKSIKNTIQVENNILNQNKNLNKITNVPSYSEKSKSYTIISQPSTNEMKSQFVKKFAMFSQLHSRGCEDCELCKMKMKKLRDQFNYIYDETRSIQSKLVSKSNNK